MHTEIKRYTFKPGLPTEFEILNVSELLRSDGAKQEMTKPHRTGFYHILWFKSGKANHMVDYRQIRIARDSFLFLNKDTVHAFDGGGTYECEAILFTDNFFL